MEMKIVLPIVVVLIAALACGCSDKSTQTTINKETASVQDSTAAQPEKQEEKRTDPAAEFRELEITPSGDPKCFLSPCNCQCYPIPNVPLDKRKPTCATNCKQEYGITGCRFTNFQCYAID